MDCTTADGSTIFHHFPISWAFLDSVLVVSTRKITVQIAWH